MSFEVGSTLRNYDQLYPEISIKVYQETDTSPMVLLLQESDLVVRNPITWRIDEQPVSSPSDEVNQGQMDHCRTLLCDWGLMERPST